MKCDSIASDERITDELPCIKGHLDTPESVNQITNHFIEKYNEMGLDESGICSCISRTKVWRNKLWISKQ